MSHTLTFDTSTPGYNHDVTLDILANPLVEMAPSLAAVLAADGTAILSGLLDEQADEVIAAHAAVGLDLAGRTILGRWHTLTVRRGRGPDR